MKVPAHAKAALLLLSVVAVSTPAQAYIDPNAGGLIFQILTPILAMAMATFAFAGRQISRGWSTIYRAARTLFSRVLGSSSRDLE